MTGATRYRYYWLKLINQRTESHNKKDHEKKQRQRRDNAAQKNEIGRNKGRAPNPKDRENDREKG